MVELAIGIVAFVVAAAALTVPEVLAETSITGDSDATTYFGENEDKPWGSWEEFQSCFDSLDSLEGCVNDLLERN